MCKVVRKAFLRRWQLREERTEHFCRVTARCRGPVAGVARELEAQDREQRSGVR